MQEDPQSEIDQDQEPRLPMGQVYDEEPQHEPPAQHIYQQHSSGVGTGTGTDNISRADGSLITDEELKDDMTVESDYVPKTEEEVSE